MIDWILSNYLDVGVISILFFMPLFLIVNKIEDGKYSSGLIIFAVLVCSLCWIVSIPYCVIGFIVDSSYKARKK